MEPVRQAVRLPADRGYAHEFFDFRTDPPRDMKVGTTRTWSQAGTQNQTSPLPLFMEFPPIIRVF